MNWRVLRVVKKSVAERDRGKKKMDKNGHALDTVLGLGQSSTFSGRKTDPEFCVGFDCNCRRSWVHTGVYSCILEPTHATRERPSERARYIPRTLQQAMRKWTAARKRFFGPENVQRGCQPGYLVREYSVRKQEVSSSIRRTWTRLKQ